MVGCGTLSRRGDVTLAATRPAGSSSRSRHRDTFEDVDRCLSRVSLQHREGQLAFGWYPLPIRAIYVGVFNIYVPKKGQLPLSTKYADVVIVGVVITAYLLCTPFISLRSETWWRKLPREVSSYSVPLGEKGSYQCRLGSRWRSDCSQGVAYHVVLSTKFVGLHQVRRILVA